MKTHILIKIISGMAIVCAAILPQNSGAQDQPVSADGIDQPAAPAALPPDILPTSPLAEVIKLTQAGVSEKIVSAYISNSSGAFSLDTDKIIYLTNIGMPDEFVTAMMQHDQQLLAQAVSPPPAAPAETTGIATSQPVEATQVNFDDTLAPYGRWVAVQGYGRCWRPTVAFYDTGWQPYSDHGHWIYTDAGWYWASDYSWGVTFHYGRWFRDARSGWCWWPDTTWAPSWVAWRYSDDYCGWAPLPPRAVYREGVGIYYNGVAVGADFDFGLGVNLFTFVPVRNICDPHPHNYRVAPAEVVQIYNRTTVINNFGVNGRDRTFINNGIPPDRISNITHAEIHRFNIHESSAPVPRGQQIGRDTIIVNRPHFADHPGSDAPGVTIPHDRISSPEQDVPRPMTPRKNPEMPAPRNPQPPQNDFQHPAINQNPPPEIQQPAIHVPQDRNGDFTPPMQHQPSPQSPATGAAVQKPAADYNSRRQSQPQQTGAPRDFTHDPETQQSPSPALHNQISAPAANNFAPPISQPLQHDVNPRQNDSPPSDSHPIRSESPPSAVHPQISPAQTPASATPPAQSNPGGKGRNQNGQQQ
jgi:hypothetical protein